MRVSWASARIAGSSAASTRSPAVWPSGTSRTAAEIRLAAERLQIGGGGQVFVDADAAGERADRDRIRHALRGESWSGPHARAARMKAVPWSSVSLAVRGWTPTAAAEIRKLLQRDRIGGGAMARGAGMIVVCRPVR